MVLEIGSVESARYPSDEIQLWGWPLLPEAGRWSSLTAALTRHRNKWPLTIEGSHHPGWEGRVSQRLTAAWMTEVFMSTVFMAVLAERVVGSVFYNLGCSLVGRHSR